MVSGICLMMMMIDDEIYQYISMYLGTIYLGTAEFNRGAGFIRDTGVSHLGYFIASYKIARYFGAIKSLSYLAGVHHLSYLIAAILSQSY